MVSESIYRSYAFGMKVLGFERSISGFLAELDLDHPRDASILDVGCGTGILGLSLMKNRPYSTLVATDVNRDLLDQTLRNARQQGIPEQRVTLGVSDISSPDVAMTLDGSENPLVFKEFDVVSTGATIGYSKNPEHTIRVLLGLVKKSGYFINLEMGEGLLARQTSRRYRYSMMPLSAMEDVIKNNGFEATRVSVRNFPACLTRTCYIARRK